MKMRKICWSISNITSSGDVFFKVTFIPKWLGTLFGKKEVSVIYKKDPDYKYAFGGYVYYDRTGKALGNGNWIGESIDQYLKSW